MAPRKALTTSTGNASRPRAQQDYNLLKVPDLKGICKKRTLPVGGTRLELVKRLFSADGRPIPSDDAISTHAPPKKTGAIPIKRRGPPLGTSRREKKQKSLSPDTKGLYDDYAREDLAIRRGPNGPPVKDTQGFELDPKLCAQARTRPRKPTMASTNRMLAHFEKSRECKKKVLGTSLEGSHHQDDSVVRDRVARDLGMQYHEVGLEALEEWGRRGFRLEEGFFEKITAEQRERADKLMEGCAFRKGYDKSW